LLKLLRVQISQARSLRYVDGYAPFILSIIQTATMVLFDFIQ